MYTCARPLIQFHITVPGQFAWPKHKTTEVAAQEEAARDRAFLVVNASGCCRRLNGMRLGVTRGESGVGRTPWESITPHITWWFVYRPRSRSSYMNDAVFLFQIFRTSKTPRTVRALFFLNALKLRKNVKPAIYVVPADIPEIRPRLTIQLNLKKKKLVENLITSRLYYISHCVISAKILTFDWLTWSCNWSYF